MGSPVVAVSPRKSPLSGRRINKPLVEKKRRARINGCLGQLKSLILSAMQTEQNSQVSRLEKADILEMTVKYLRQVQRQQVTSEPDVVAKFSAGYTECATEVIRYMDAVQCVAPEVRSRLECHLVERLKGSAPVPSNVSSVGDASSVSAFNVISSSQARANDVHSRQFSPTTISPQEMNRHYQTAIDLANMASSALSKEATSNQMAVLASVTTNPSQRPVHPSTALTPLKAISTNVPMAFNMNVPSRCLQPANINTNKDIFVSNTAEIVKFHRISDARIQSSESSIAMLSSTSSVYNDSDARQRYNCAASQSYFSLASREVTMEQSAGRCGESNNNCNHPSNSSCNNKINPTVSDYLDAFQRPLHIHIPDSPPPQTPLSTTPSPPFLQPHVAYPQGSSAANLVPVSEAGSRHIFEEAPATILYGCEDYQLHGQNIHSPQFSDASRSSNGSAFDVNTNQLLHSVNNPASNFACRTDNNNINITYNNRSQVKTTFTNRHLDTNSIIHPIQVHGHRPLPSQIARATPSPPTLVPEESYSMQFSNTTNHPCNNNYHHLSSKDRPSSREFQISFSSSFQERPVSNSNQTDPTNPEYQHLSHQQHQLSSVSYNHNQHITSAREYPTVQTPGNVSTNNDHLLTNGPHQTSRVPPSRQNDTSLSPPTLKRRLLLYQGSESDWPTPRCNGVNSDKRSIQDAGLPGSGQSPRPWRETGSKLSRGTYSSIPAVMFCTTLVHGGSADDGLWRPW